jgi:hypothetical protein
VDETLHLVKAFQERPTTGTLLAFQRLFMEGKTQSCLFISITVVENVTDSMTDHRE